jgi:hypothetical protein
MSKFLLLAALYLSFSLYAKENIIRVIKFSGQVEILGNGKNISPTVNGFLPSDSNITIKKNSNLEISINEEVYLIKGPIEINLQKIASLRNITKTITHSGGVRGLQNDLVTQIEEASEQAYNQYIDSHNGKLQDYHKWKPILERVFRKLMQASGREPFKLKYAILQDNEFNAAAFPNGQFIIHTATLDRIDAESHHKAGTNDKSFESFRENYASGIIGHELAHYYNNHTLQKVKKVISSGEAKQESYQIELIDEINFSKELELDADKSGLILLQLAGYKTSSMTEMLDLLNKVHQEILKVRKKQIPYFTSHPSPHDRLKVFEGSKKELHEWAANMEKVFADIQLGKDLDKAKMFLEKSLKKEEFEENLELTKALAVCLHKIWLETVPLKNQYLRSILDMPSFRDDMVFQKEESTKGDEEIPGDITKYFDAKDKYEEVIFQTGDLQFISNYATLLSYYVNDKKEETQLQRQNAIILAELSSATKTIQAYNNLALVYYNVNKKQEALTIIRQFSSQINKAENAKRFLAILSPAVKQQFIAEAKQDKLGLYFNSNYVRDDYTPILNLAILEYIDGNKTNAKEYARVYFSLYDSESKWAKYLSNLTGEKIDEEKSNEVNLDSKLQIGMKKKNLENLMGKDYKVHGGYRIYNLKNDKKVYVRLNNGVIEKIEKK